MSWLYPTQLDLNRPFSFSPSPEDWTEEACEMLGLASPSHKNLIPAYPSLEIDHNEVFQHPFMHTEMDMDTEENVTSDRMPISELDSNSELQTAIWELTEIDSSIDNKYDFTNVQRTRTPPPSPSNIFQNSISENMQLRYLSHPHTQIVEAKELLESSPSQKEKNSQKIQMSLCPDENMIFHVKHYLHCVEQLPSLLEEILSKRNQAQLFFDDEEEDNEENESDVDSDEDTIMYDVEMCNSKTRTAAELPHNCTINQPPLGQESPFWIKHPSMSIEKFLDRILQYLFLENPGEMAILAILQLEKIRRFQRKLIDSPVLMHKYSSTNGAVLMMLQKETLHLFLLLAVVQQMQQYEQKVVSENYLANLAGITVERMHLLQQNFQTSFSIFGEHTPEDYLKFYHELPSYLPNEDRLTYPALAIISKKRLKDLKKYLLFQTKETTSDNDEVKTFTNMKVLRSYCLTPIVEE
jgi:hypothetical protein